MGLTGLTSRGQHVSVPGSIRAVPLVTTMAVGLITAAVLSLVAFRGWIPHDEGTLGQTAVRILDGQWPHADFHDVYPGLLGVIHALVFKALGVSIASLRLVWLVVAGLASGSLFWLLHQRLTRLVAAAGAIGVTVAVWALYPASIPTWWNLALGLVAIALVYSGTQGERSGRILLAGFLIGVSFLIKTIGGALIAVPVFLWLAIRSDSPAVAKRVAMVGAGVFAAMLVAPVLSASRMLFLAFPVVTAIVLLMRRWPIRPLEPPGRLRGQPALLLLTGSLTPPVLVILLYAATGRWSSLWTGWVSSPALRFGVEAAERDVLFDLKTLLLGAAVVALTVVGARTGIEKRVGLMVGALGLTVWGFLDWPDFGQTLFGLTTWAPVSLALLIVIKRFQKPADDLAALVVVCAFFFLLIQIPLWSSFYAAYAVPLTLAAVLLSVPRLVTPLVIGVGVTAAIIMFQSLTGHLFGPRAIQDSISYVFLESPRAGIWVPEADAYYDDLVTRVSSLGSESIYAGPDAPEVAFLAEVSSVAPDFFEVLNADWDPVDIGDIAREGVPVVINSAPTFSDPIPQTVLEVVQSVHVRREVHGKFEIFWSD